MGMLGALAQLFFSYEDLRTLDNRENEYQLQRTKRLLNENFGNIKKIRFITLLIGGILLPLLALVFVSGASVFVASIILAMSLVVSFLSEISDRFLFYTTVVPLGMAGGFFVGKQR
jgi:magnesium-transporting ATPase (P-type)